MPDDDRLAKYRAGMAAYAPPADEDLSHLAARAVVECELCDDDGYRGRVICDHRDHTGAAKRGMTKVQQALDIAKAKRRAVVACTDNQPQEDT